MQPFIQKFFINFFFVQSLFKQLGLNYRDINEMAERFSQKNLRVRPSSDEEKIVTNAKNTSKRLWLKYQASWWEA